MSNRIEELIITLPENVKSDIRKEIENIKFLERMDVKLNQCINKVNEIVENRNKIINNTGLNRTLGTFQQDEVNSFIHIPADLSYLTMM